MAGPLQPSGSVPQLPPGGQLVSALHPHWPAVPPPPHVWGAMQVPQDTVPPQPSGAVEQFCPTAHAFAGVSGVQPHLLGTPPPAHV